MKLLVRPSEDAIEESAIERLEDRIGDKLGTRDINADYEILENFLVVNMDEESVPIAVHSLKYLTGISEIYPCVSIGSNDINAESVVQKIGEENIELDKFRLSIEGDAEGFSRERLVDLLEGEGYTQDPQGREIKLHLLEDRGFISMDMEEGAGGLPIKEGNTALLPLIDRLYTCAGFLMMKEGYRLVPVVQGGELDAVKEGVEVLEEYQPGLKPVIVGKDSWKKVVTQSLKILKPDIVVDGRIKGEESLIDSENLEIPVRSPLKGKSEEEVLELYTEIRPFRV
ncbi:MAG: hypothetical protein SVV03_02885 [Candidatus Nanohaloarchaea archaeon]|nr:hypothetical protein [Candidatus Nanohaloarchaea archaeon]